MADLANTISTFADSMNSYWTHIKIARSATQEYYYSDNVDLYHFADLITQYVPDSTIVNNANDLKTKITSSVIAEWHGPSRPNSHGLAIYFPEGYVSSSYNGSVIDLPQDTTWDEFLKRFIANKARVVPMPGIQRVAICDLTRIDVYFDGEVPTDITPAIFSVTQDDDLAAKITVTSVRVDRENNRLVHLTTSPLTEGKFYIITLNKVRGLGDIPDTSLEFGIIKSGVIRRGKTRLEIAPGTFDGYISIHFDLAPASDKITAADSTAWNESRIDILLPNTVWEITAYDQNGELLSPAHFKKRVRLTIPYKDNYFEQDELFFRIFYLDEANSMWVLVPGRQEVDYINNTVTASIPHFSLYRVAQTTGTVAQDLADVKVYPNPYKPSKTHHDFIIFENLTDDVKIRVFNIAGELVCEEELDYGGIYKWDGTNNDGDKLASGIYIYIITNDEGDMAKGKLSIIK